MKKKGLILIVTVIGITSFLLQANKFSQKSKKVNLSLLSLEALAENEDNNNGETDNEKKFRYQTWEYDACYIYVGGVYAKGKKVTCYSGNEHPICVDCAL